MKYENLRLLRFRYKLQSESDVKSRGRRARGFDEFLGAVKDVDKDYELGGRKE